MRHIKTYKLFESTRELTSDQIRLLDLATRSTPDQKNWSLNSQGLVDIPGDFLYLGWGRDRTVALSRPDPDALTDFKGIRFGEIGGQFLVNHNELTSLEGAPHTVGSVFNCEGNAITSLKGAPQRVGGHFICNNNPLKSLEGAPQEFGYRDDPRMYPRGGQYPSNLFSCNNCTLKDLKGSPQHVPGTFSCTGNPLESLDGAPLRVDGDFICDYFKMPNGEWGTPVGFIKVLGGHPDCNVKPGDREKAKHLVLPFLDDDIIDDYYVTNPLEMDLLDEFPDIKAGVLKRTGLKDLSRIARSIRQRLI
jgi:hypothetical protein